jgi:hypothetical protein
MGATRRRGLDGRSTSALLVVAVACAIGVGSAPPADCEYLHDEEELRLYPDDAIIASWVQMPTRQYPGKPELMAYLDVFRPYGANEDFATYCEEITISVDDYLETEWATQNAIVVNGHNYSRLDPISGHYWFTKLKYVFQPGEGIKLNVFYYNRTFIDKVCGNFTPRIDPPPHPNEPPVAVGVDQTVEQTSRDGATAALNGSQSHDPDGDPLTYVWTEEGKTIAGPTAEANVQITLPLGQHNLTLEVSDGRGGVSSDPVTVVVRDTTPPDLSAPPSITAEQTSRDGTPVDLGAASVSDICDANPNVANNAPRVFPLGTTTVTWTATDASGNRSTDQQCVTIKDTTPPDLNVPDGITVEQETSNGTKVPFEVTATDICDADPLVVCQPPSGTEFPLGTTEVVAKATDASGNSTEDRFHVTVEDTTPPQAQLSTSQTSLWPPYHELLDVGLQLFVADICDHNPGIVISVTQDEPVEDQTGDGHFAPDAKLVAGTQGNTTAIRLRAERKGDGDGRVYLIIVAVTDASGNVTKKCCAVTVPKSQSKRDRDDVAAQAAAAVAAGVPLAYDSTAGPEIGPKQ